MRRWLAILLLTLLPLQSSWAAVAAYCGHEAGQPARHLGHHEHQHASQADEPAAPAADGGAASFHFDCGHCHSSCVSLPMALAGPLPLVTKAPVGAGTEPSLRSLAQSPPERPQWQLLA